MIDGKIDQEVDEICSKLDRLSEDLRPSRVFFKECIQLKIQQIIPEEEITVSEYGSYRSSLLTPYSDMDLQIEHPQEFDREQSIGLLEKIELSLK